MAGAHDELLKVADQLDDAASTSQAAQQNPLDALAEVATEFGKAASGSWLGYHANVYYEGFKPPPPGAHFDTQWGLKDMSITSFGSRGDWREFDPDEVKKRILKVAGNPDLAKIEAAAADLVTLFDRGRSEVLSILTAEPRTATDAFLSDIRTRVDRLSITTKGELVHQWAPNNIMSSDYVALGQGLRTPPHVSVLASVAALRNPMFAVQELAALSRKAGSHLHRIDRSSRKAALMGTNVFIGHGRSAVWRDLKDFVQDRLKLPWDEFNRVPVAGIANLTRLNEMLEAAAMAFLVLTAEDELADGTTVARQNVVHEAGLFQGRLGFTKAIILLEEGCAEFSNIHGIGQIRFPKGNISAAFEEVRRVLEREGVIPT